MRSYSCVNYSGVSNTRVSTYSCVSARPSRRTGVRGEPARKKARTKKGHGRHRFPPAKLKGGHKPVQVLFVCVSVWPWPRREKKLSNTSEAATSVTGMEGSVKNKNQKYFQPWLWAKAKPPMNIFPNGFAFAHCHTKGFVFFTVPECLARLFARGHKQKVLAHRFYLVACRRMPSAGQHVRWPCGRMGLGISITYPIVSKIIPSITFSPVLSFPFPSLFLSSTPFR